MPSIDRNTGQAVCPYGTQIKPSFDETTIDILSGVVIAAVFGVDFAGVAAGAVAAMGIHEISVDNLCAQPPPVPDDWTLTDTIGILNPLQPDFSAYKKLLDWAAVGAWMLCCECKPVQLPGWSSMGCGKMNFGGGAAATSDPLPYRADSTGGFRLVYSAVPAGATRVDINVQSRHGDGSWWTELLIRCEPGGHPYADSFEFTKVGALVDATTTAVRLVCGTGDPLPIVSLDWCLYYEPTQITAPEPLPPEPPHTPLPLPPGYEIPHVLTPPECDLSELHALREFVMPDHWTPGMPMALNGTGTVSLPDGTAGLWVVLTDVPATDDRDAGNPALHYALGWLAPASAAGARTRWKLDKTHQMFWGVYPIENALEYNLYPPINAVVTPLIRGA